MDNNKTHISWTIPEYRQYSRSRRWYIIASSIMALLLIYSVVTANFLFAVIIIVVSITVLMHDKKSAPEIDFSIQEEGVRFGKAFHPYSAFRSFWIYWEPNEAKTLFLEFKNKMRPRISIPLKNKNPLKVRAILLKYLTEDVENENEPLSEQLSRLLKL